MQFTLAKLKDLIKVFSDFDRTTILRTAVQNIAELLQAKGCSIFLYDDLSDRIVLAETTGLLKTDDKVIYYAKGEGLTGWVFKHQKPLLLARLQNLNLDDLKKQYGDDIYLRNKYTEGNSSDICSWMGVPIVSNTARFYGVLRTSSMDEDFTNDQLELLLDIGNYLGIALENSDRYMQQQKKADYFKMLTEVGMLLHTYYKRSELLNYVAKAVVKTFSSESCEIYLREDDNSNILTLRAGYGVPDELINFASHEIGEGLTGTLVKENRIIRLKNVLNFPKYKGKYRNKMKETLKHGDRLAFLGIPIAVKTHVIGCMKLYNKVPKYPGEQNWFTEDDEHYLSILGYMLSVALENIQYIESMENSAKQIVKTQRLTALGTMAIRLPNEITNSLTTAQLNVKNLISRVEYGNLTNDKLFKLLKSTEESLKEVSSGVQNLHEFSTKAGFSKIVKSWQALLDESLLFLSEHILQKKINLTRNRLLDTKSRILVEPNEITEVLINLLMYAIVHIKHYDGQLNIVVQHNEVNKLILTTIESIDDSSNPAFETTTVKEQYDGDIVTPQRFMLDVAIDIVQNNYKGKVMITPKKNGILITLLIPQGEIGE
ncbi:MAG: GAF domain-containing protein [Candidatus Cloacimonetes bacterium]|nr:GAF domain-containing protein [Candidatus Cloacimonadota bacterium]